MSFLNVRSVNKNFGGNAVVKQFNLAVERGEFISFLGPSGCGKTTVLRMIAGFETPSSGTITIDGTDVTNLPPNRRKIGMVFQAYALFPNLDVFGNVAFGLRVAGMAKPEIEARVGEMLRLIGLEHLAERYPYQLSGGQQQRVALARALAPKPQVLLLDEPLSALDAKIRVSLRQEIRDIQKRLGITTIFVTHDQEEALSMSDRIVVMNAGNIEQHGAPHEIYNKPATRFVATFVGQLNNLDVTVLDPVTKSVSIDGQAMTVPNLSANATAGASSVLTLRPEVLCVGARDGNDITLSGTIADVTFLGSVIRLRVALGKNTVSLDTFNDQRTAPPNRGEPVTISLASKDLLVLSN